MKTIGSANKRKWIKSQCEDWRQPGWQKLYMPVVAEAVEREQQASTHFGFAADCLSGFRHHYRLSLRTQS
ncbi:hypothetical protein KCP75_05740 [Salmonella enterica subsp. enterica]|nr:hypothetical protein KCP75_05740 [Salmonella enterica subsp. enterica]